MYAFAATIEGFAEEVGDDCTLLKSSDTAQTLKKIFFVCVCVLGFQFYPMPEAECQNGTSEFRREPNSVTASVCWYVVGRNGQMGEE